MFIFVVDITNIFLPLYYLHTALNSQLLYILNFILFYGIGNVSNDYMCILHINLHYLEGLQ